MESYRAMFEIVARVALELEVEAEYFLPIPKPPVRTFGVAANAGGHLVAKIVEISASKVHYLVVVELPQVLNCHTEVDWVVNDDGEITIKGQLCPTEPWAISFYLPGLVDWWTTEVLFTSENIMEITVIKSRQEAETAAADSMAVDVAGPSGCT